MNTTINEIEKTLSLFFRSLSPELKEIKAPVKTLIKRGGKRIRPLLSLIFASKINPEFNKALLLKLCALLEVIHNSTLIVDDIEDSSPLRRGKKAIHLIYGIDASINSSNLFYFLPFDLIKDFQPSLKLEIYEKTIQTLKELHIGQGFDILWHQENIIPTKDEYIEVIRLKTGKLFALAGFFAQIASNSEKNISMFFEKLGICFQISDDIKNFIKIKGKKIADDLYEGKKSLPIILLSKKIEKKRLFFLMEEIKHEKNKEKQNKLIKNFVKLLIETKTLEKAQKILLKEKLNLFEELKTFNLENDKEILQILNEI